MPLIFVFAAQIVEVTPQRHAVEILEVLDGDTVEVRYLETDKQDRVRLLFIDAPEMKQPGGKMAKLELEELIARSTIILEMRGRGYYGRILGVLFKHGSVLNLEMIKRGAAHLYPYSRFRTWKEKLKFTKQFEIAKRKSRGIWSDKQVQKPWNYRRMTKRKLKKKKISSL